MDELRRRGFLIGLGAAICLPGTALAKSVAHPPKILFVCQYGTVKSAIARELLKRRAAERRIVLFVASRGITPEQHLPPDLMSRLAADGIDPSSEPLQRLTQSDLDRADQVIIFDKLPAGMKPRAVEDWTDLSSMINAYDKARAELDRRIDALVTRLER